MRFRSLEMILLKSRSINYSYHTHQDDRDITMSQACNNTQEENKKSLDTLAFNKVNYANCILVLL